MNLPLQMIWERLTKGVANIIIIPYDQMLRRAWEIAIGHLRIVGPTTFVLAAKWGVGIHPGRVQPTSPM